MRELHENCRNNTNNSQDSRSHFIEVKYASEIHVGNIGTRFSITIQEGGSSINISGATTKDVIFRKPDDEVIVRSGVLTGDGTDGKMYYDTVSGDLDEAGHYKLQANSNSY